jgi:hypothetical protein
MTSITSQIDRVATPLARYFIANRAEVRRDVQISFDASGTRVVTAHLAVRRSPRPRTVRNLATGIEEERPRRDLVAVRCATWPCTTEVESCGDLANVAEYVVLAIARPTPEVEATESFMAQWQAIWAAGYGLVYVGVGDDRIGWIERPRFRTPPWVERFEGIFTTENTPGHESTEVGHG